MTTATTWSIDGTVTPATVARRMMAGLVGAGGVDADAALAVSERAAAANNSWDIAAGGAWFLVDGEVWHAWWPDTNIPATAADGTSDRIDLIVAELRADGSNNDAIVRVVTGTPGDTNEPAVAGDGSVVVLARADVTSGAGSMVDGFLTDRRVPAVAARSLIAGLVDVKNASTQVNSALTTVVGTAHLTLNFPDPGGPVKLAVNGWVKAQQTAGTNQDLLVDLAIDGDTPAEAAAHEFATTGDASTVAMSHGRTWTPGGPFTVELRLWASGGSIQHLASGVTATLLPA